MELTVGADEYDTAVSFRTDGPPVPSQLQNVISRRLQDCSVLPDEGGERQYRIKNDGEAHERVVNESDLESV